MSGGERNWYVVKTYAGYENKVKKNLEHRKVSLDAGDRIFHIEIPRGIRGYVLVETIADDKSWKVVRNTPGVLGVEMLDLGE
jgi:transcription termination/antitermination protein NusG